MQVSVGLTTLRAAIAHASKDAGRFQLHSVLFHPDGVVATDGKRLFVGDYAEEPEELPLSDGVIVGLPELMAIAKGGKSADGTVIVEFHGTAPEVTACTITRGPMTIAGDVIEGRYPPFQKAMPTPPVWSITMSPTFLAETCKVLAAMTPKQHQSVKLGFVNARNAMLLEVPGAKSIIMPLITDSTPREVLTVTSDTKEGAA